MPGEKSPFEEEPLTSGVPADAPDEEGAGARGFVADAVKKAVLAGVGALFLTEEGARKVAREWKLPKELIGYVATQAGGAKDEILRVVGDELRRFFESDTLRRELIKALGSMSIEVKAEIRIKEAKGGKVKPSVHASIRPRLRKEREGEGDED